MRRAQAVARLSGLGGQSVAYITAYAAALGYVVAITQFSPARVGQSRVGMPLAGPAWAHVWQVDARLNTVNRSRVGSAAVGEPLACWGNTVLECELRDIAPAHTAVIFTYT